MTKDHGIDLMFNPKTIAIVGASRENASKGWTGLLPIISEFGFPGRIYPINPNALKINGLKTYRDLVSVPEPIDLVIISVSAPAVPDALRDCIASGNKNVHIFTAGFKETGEEEGIKLQREIEEIANSGGLRVIGPNCMGLYIPGARLVTWSQASKESGPVAFVSQSGGYAGDFTNYSNQLGIRFSKVISYGNALTLDSTDFIEYLADDAETAFITMYLEGVKDGNKLLRLVKETNRTKPVIIMKGGLTESGTRAVNSHTGSMAGEEHTWRAFFRQTGAVRVDSLEEMADVTLSFLCLGPIRGRRAALIGTGGGNAVAAADICNSEGLEVPILTQETRRELRRFIPYAGSSIMNPLDVIVYYDDDMGLLQKTLDTVSADPLVDILIVSLQLDWLWAVSENEHIATLTDYLTTSARDHVHDKPFVVSLNNYMNSPGLDKARMMLGQKLIKAGIPVYQGLRRAASALSSIEEYHRFHGQQEKDIGGNY